MEKIKFEDLKQYTIPKETKDTRVSITRNGRIAFGKDFLEKYPTFHQYKSADVYYSKAKTTLLIRLYTVEKENSIEVKNSNDRVWINAKKVMNSFSLYPEDLKGLYADQIREVDDIGECLVIQLPEDIEEKTIDRIFSSKREPVDTESQDYNSY